MATKEELLQKLKERRKHYEQWHNNLLQMYPPPEVVNNDWNHLEDENHKLRLTTLQISLSLYRYEIILNSMEVKQWHHERIEMFLEELNECPTKEPEKHLRYRGYYR